MGESGAAKTEDSTEERRRGVEAHFSTEPSRPLVFRWRLGQLIELHGLQGNLLGANTTVDPYHLFGEDRVEPREITSAPKA